MGRAEKNTDDRRRVLLKLGVGGSFLAIWHQPVINTIALPAHAQTSLAATSIVVSSLDADNPFARFIVIVDSSDTVLANCGSSGGTATANELPAGTYRVFADSDGPQNQQITVSTDTNSQSISVPTDTGACNFLVATINLPAGTISPATGEEIAGPWDCFTNQNANCS